MTTTTNSITTAQPARQSGTFQIGGDLPVARLGYGAMRLTGPGIWGPPPDHDEAVRVLRRAVELGVTLIDTADSYGPYVSEELIREALHPYPGGLVIATKAGQVRTGPGEWHPLGRPEFLRQEAEMSLRRLGLERIDLFQLHRVDPRVPLDDQVGVMVELQREGKVRHIGLSNVSVPQVRAALQIARIATVQNRYNLADRTSEAVLELCVAEGLGFIPWFPIATGDLARRGGRLERIATDLAVTPAQLALAWLLRRSPVMLPIPGTASVAHLEENVAAAAVKLDDAQFETPGEPGGDGWRGMTTEANRMIQATNGGPGNSTEREARILMDGLVNIRSRYSVSATIDRLQAAAQEMGMAVFARIDHAEGAADAGLYLRPTQLLVFGNARAGTPLMQARQTVGIDLPLKALAWEDADRTVWLTYNEPAWIARRHWIGPDLEHRLAGMTEVLAHITRGAAGVERPLDDGV